MFVASAVWDIRNWTLAGVLTLQSGVPLAISQTTNNNAFAGFGTRRPNLIGDPVLPGGEQSVSRWFSTRAFEPAAAFTIGTSSRNPVRGPGYRSLDLALMRRVHMWETKALELRAEVFNATNTPPPQSAEYDTGFRGLRHDHLSRRSSRRAAGGEVHLLIF